MDVRFSARVRACCAQFHVVSSNNRISYFAYVHRTVSKTKSFRHPVFCISCQTSSFARSRSVLRVLVSLSPSLPPSTAAFSRGMLFSSFRRNFIKSPPQFETPTSAVSGYRAAIHNLLPLAIFLPCPPPDLSADFIKARRYLLSMLYL